MLPIAKKAGANVARLRQGLRALLDLRGVTPHGLSLQQERGPNYWGRVLGGRLEPRVEDVFQVLFDLEVSGDLFFIVYLGPYECPPPGQPLPSLPAGGPEHWDGEVWLTWTRARLRSRAAQAGPPLREVARALDLPEDGIARALQGRSSLTFRVVFGLLAAWGVPPWRFFMEAAPPTVPLPAGVSWGGLLDLSQKGLEPAR